MHVLSINYHCKRCKYLHKEIDLDLIINDFDKFKCMPICEKNKHNKQDFLEHLYSELIDIKCDDCGKYSTVIKNNNFESINIPLCDQIRCKKSSKFKVRDIRSAIVYYFFCEEHLPVEEIKGNN